MDGPDTEPLALRRPLSTAPVEPLPPGRWPARAPLESPRVRLEPVDPEVHAEALYADAHGTEAHERLWDYMAYGPFPTLDVFRAYLRECASQADPIFYALADREAGDRLFGVASYMRVQPKDGSIEIGHIWIGPGGQRRVAATEALYRMMSHALDDLRNRRLEWKCNAANAKSRSAARRLGFAFEGIFYNHQISKGRNRDTAWYSILAEEWPPIRKAFERWLAPANFDGDGRQRERLSDLTAAARGEPG